MVYLLTTTTWRREPLFADWRIGRLVVAEMRNLHDHQQAESLAWVLMPDHWHWLLRLGDSTAGLAQLINTVKGRAARAINLQLNRTGPVWQSGYHDHAMRGDENLRTAVRYVIANPLRAGLVGRLGEYPLWDCAWDIWGWVGVGNRA